MVSTLILRTSVALLLLFVLLPDLFELLFLFGSQNCAETLSCILPDIFQFRGLLLLAQRLIAAHLHNSLAMVPDESPDFLLLLIGELQISHELSHVGLLLLPGSAPTRMPGLRTLLVLLGFGSRLPRTITGAAALSAVCLSRHGERWSVKCDGRGKGRHRNHHGQYQKPAD